MANYYWLIFLRRLDMNRDPRVDEALKWIDDMEAIAARTDLTQEQKEALVREKIKNYKEQQRVLLDAEEQQRAEARKSMSPVEQALDELGWVFHRGVREGGIRVKPFLVYDEEEHAEQEEDKGKK